MLHRQSVYSAKGLNWKCKDIVLQDRVGCQDAMLKSMMSLCSLPRQGGAIVISHLHRNSGLLVAYGPFGCERLDQVKALNQKSKRLDRETLRVKFRDDCSVLDAKTIDSHKDTASTVNAQWCGG